MWELNEERAYMDRRFTVRRRVSDYMAFTTHDSRTWEAGRSPDEALGKLVIAFGEIVVWKPSTSEV
jgi:hypothetical protein